MKFLIISLFVLLVVSRPTRPIQSVGEVRNYGNQKKFSFDNTNLKRESPTEPTMKYDIELVDGFHSLDESMFIEDVECAESSLKIYSSTTEIDEWNIGDILFGSEMWSCGGSFSRKVKSIEKLSKKSYYHIYLVETDKVEAYEFFENAQIFYEFPEQLSNGQDNGDIADNLKRETIGLEFSTPKQYSIVESYNGIETEYMISGCSQETCGNITVTFDIFESGTDIMIDKGSDICSYATSYSCNSVVKLKGYYKYSSKYYVKAQFNIGNQIYDGYKTESFEVDHYKVLFKDPQKGMQTDKDGIVKLSVEWTHIVKTNFDFVYVAVIEKGENVDTPTGKTYKLSTDKTEFNLLVDESYEYGKRYYFLFDVAYDGSTVATDSSISEYFDVVQPVTDSIVLVSPVTTDKYTSGQQIPVKWVYEDEPTYTTMKMRLKMVNKEGIDTTVNELEVSPMNKEYTYTIPNNLQTSTKYYIECEYTPSGKTTNYVSSQYFTIYAQGQQQQYFTLIDKDVNKETNEVTLRWKMNRYLGKYYTSIHSNYPIIDSDPKIDGTSDIKITNTQVNQEIVHTFKYSKGTIFKSYVKFEFNCFEITNWFTGTVYETKTFCDEEKFDIGDIPYKMNILSWNLDDSGFIVEPEKELIHIACEEGEAIGISNKAFEDTCKNFSSFSFGFKTVCENCYVSNPTYIHGGVFSMNILKGEIHQAALKLTSDFIFDLNFVHTIYGTYHYSKDFEIMSEKSKMMSIAVGPVIITITFSLKIDFVFDLTATLTVEMRNTFYKDYQLAFDFDSTRTNDVFQYSFQDLTPGNGLTTTFGGSAVVELEPHLKPIFGIGLGLYGIDIIQGNMNVKAGLGITIAFQYPPFEADPKYLVLPGKLEVEHYSRLDIGFFLRINFEFEVLGFSVAESDDIHLIKKEDNTLFSFGFIPVKQKQTISFNLYSSNSQIDESETFLKLLSYDIGKLANRLEKRFNKFNVYTKVSTTANTYEIIFIDENIDENLKNEVERCVKSIYCQEKIDSETYPLLSSIMIDFVDSKTSLCGDNCKWSIVSNTLTISGTGEMYNYSNYCSSSEKTGKPGYCEYASSITKVVIEKGITSIGKLSFSEFKISNVEIPDSVIVIGESAFEVCEELSTVSIPNSVISIKSYAFYFCSSLTNVNLGDSIEFIGLQAFFGCYNLPSIIIPESVKTIEGAAFGECDALNNFVIKGSNLILQNNLIINKNEKEIMSVIGSQDTVTIPDTIEKIGTSAFGCSKIIKVIIPNSVKTIGYGAFQLSSIENIEIPSSVTFIEDYLFYRSTSLKTVTLPNSIITIGECAFELCTSLQTINIPNTVRSIGEYAFYRCESLTSITIPSSLTDIQEAVFASTSITSIIIPETVKTIGTYVFYYCKSLKSITIPSSVTSIGSYAFYKASSLNKVEIPNTITSIDKKTFYGCTSLESINIPTSVTSIGESAFYGCKLITSITIPSGVKSIANNLFEYCESLKSISLHSGITSIGESAFSYCTSLTSINIPSSVTSIGDTAFISCTSLTSITIPNSVTTLNKGVFYNCEVLTSVNIPSSVTSIGYCAFWGCSSLKSITIPSSVKSIGEYAFEECTSLTHINIPTSVTIIRYAAFYNCKSLTSIMIPDSVTTIDDFSFTYCDLLKSVTIGKHVSHIGLYAFSYCSQLTEVNFLGKYNPKFDQSFDYSDSVSMVNVFSGYNGNKFCGKNVNKILAQSKSCGDDCEWYMFGKTFLYITGSGKMNSYTFNSMPWVDNTEFTAVQIDGLQNIGSYALSYLPKLTDVYLSDRIETIEPNSFYNCPSLRNIILPGSVKTIDSKAFAKCTSLETIFFKGYHEPTCQSDTFTDSSNFKMVYVSYSYQINTFCTKPITNIHICLDLTNENGMIQESCTCQENAIPLNSEKCECIEGYKEKDGMCIDLLEKEMNAMHLNKPGETGQIDDGPIKKGKCGDDCSWSVEKNSIRIEGNGKMKNYDTEKSTIPWGVFKKDIKIVEIIEGITSVGDYTFTSFPYLETVLLPPGIESIGKFSFYECTSLKSITLPASVSAIYHSAFLKCTSLININYLGTTMVYTDTDSFWNTGLSSICVSSNFVGDIFSDPYSKYGVAVTKISPEETKCGENCQWYLLKNGMLKIGGSGEMMNYESSVDQNIPWKTKRNEIKEIYIEGGITTIGDYSFASFVSLRNVIMEKGVTRIGKNAFSSCILLASIRIPDAVVSIGENAFYYTNNLNSLKYLGQREPECGDTLFGINKKKVTVLVSRTYEGNDFCGQEKLIKESILCGALTKENGTKATNCQCVEHAEYKKGKENECSCEANYKQVENECKEIIKCGAFTNEKDKTDALSCSCVIGSEFIIGSNKECKCYDKWSSDITNNKCNPPLEVIACGELTKQYRNSTNTETCSCVNNAEFVGGKTDECKCKTNYRKEGNNCLCDIGFLAKENECVKLIQCGVLTKEKGDRENTKACSCIDKAEFVSGKTDECQCIKGYIKEGNECKQTSLVTCGDFTKEKGQLKESCTCVENAQGEGVGKNSCVCSSGYEGNGEKTECKKKETSSGGNTSNNGGNTNNNGGDNPDGSILTSILMMVMIFFILF